MRNARERQGTPGSGRAHGGAAFAHVGNALAEGIEADGARYHLVADDVGRGAGDIEALGGLETLGDDLVDIVGLHGEPDFHWIEAELLGGSERGVLVDLAAA